MVTWLPECEATWLARPGFQIILLKKLALAKIYEKTSAPWGATFLYMLICLKTGAAWVVTCPPPPVAEAALLAKTVLLMMGELLLRMAIPAPSRAVLLTK